MKITHVVTYVSKDGSYGGPLSVAVAHARMLAAAGHDVELIGGGDGTRLEIDGVRTFLPRAARLGKSFFGVMAPRVWWRTMRDARKRVFHLHLGRDLIGLPVGLVLRALGSRYVVQTHGMIRPDSRPIARLIDALLTRPVLRGASHWLVLDRNDQAALSGVANPEPGQVIEVFNTVGAARNAHSARGDRIPTVVFASRLHPRKNVLLFAEAARSLIEQGIMARFDIWGPDEGDLGALMAFIGTFDSDFLRYRGFFGPGEAAEVLAEADVFVLPSEGEVFPMSVLEAIEAGVAVIAPNDCPMAVALKDRGGAITTDRTPEDLSAAIRKLINQPAARAAMVDNARQVLKDLWSEEALVERLQECYV